MSDSMKFQGCYLHPQRPADRKCVNCEQPICALCEEESCEALLCLPCKEKLEKLKKPGLSKAVKDAEVAPAPKRQTPFAVGELTITEEGRVFAPSVEQKDEEKTAHVNGAEPPPEKEQPATKEIPAKPKKSSAAKTAEEAHDVKPARKRAGSASRARTKSEKPPKPPKEHRERTGPLYQLVSAIPFGVGAAVGVSCVWLVVTFLAKQWSQISVLTTGMVVPWALYKGTTMRKRHGKRVWASPLRPLWTGVTSLTVVAAITPLLEFIAYKIIYGTNSLRLPFSDFMTRYFTATDWILVVCGMALAFIMPFILVSGEDWKKPD